MLTTVAVVAYGILSRRYERALALGAVTPAGAAIAVGTEALPTFYAVALGGLGLLVWQWFARGGRPGAPPLSAIPGVSLLLALLGWAIVVVLLAPLAFPGMTTVTDPVARLVPGSISTSNIAQLLYLGLSITIVVIVARSTTTAPTLLAIPLGIGIALSLWRYLSLRAGVPFPDGVFDNSPGLVYIEQAAGGVPRFRGIHSEPSGLAVTAMAAAAYGFSFAAHVRGWRRVGFLALGVVAVFLGIESTSTTFLVGGAMLVAFAGAFLLWRLVRLHLVVTRGAAVVALAVVALVIVLLPSLLGQFTAEVDAKLDSASFTERSSSDARSFEAFIGSWGVGIGLGSVRASSLFFTLLGAVGVVGIILFVTAVLSVILPALRLSGHSPVVWALLAALLGKAIASPDLSGPSGVLWLSLGILAHGILVARRDATDPGGAEHPPPRRSLEAIARATRRRLRREADAKL
ncbi:hypothetical protein Dac01nite_01740 [Demequina activiva]|uniref:Uncharacterized protein n=2 Tax=Demequina activiva TaxID=1582364 RepID=A0A919PZQ7_9MICO|nr:hypothetical protein Dac01nite_01740 [Demequina activiva]